jgi:signal peptidase
VQRRRPGWSRLGTVLLAVALLATGFVAYGTVVDNRWYKIVAVDGGSMRPTLEVGDAIVITRPPHRVERGMVLVLEVDGQVVTHRVVEVRDDGSFTTQGDANRSRDDFSDADVRVVGVYRARVPRLGSLLEGWG